MAINSSAGVQSSSLEAFKAVEQVSSRQDANRQAAKPVNDQANSNSQASLVNRPTPGATIGSNINISA